MCTVFKYIDRSQIKQLLFWYEITLKEALVFVCFLLLRGTQQPDLLQWPSMFLPLYLMISHAELFPQNFCLQMVSYSPIKSFLVLKAAL